MMLVPCPVVEAAGHVLYRSKIGSGVVLGNPHQQAGQHQTDRRRAKNVQRADQFAVGQRDSITQHPGRDRIEGRQCQRTGYGQTTVERVHDLAAFAGLDEETADDRSDDRNPAQNQGVDDQVVAGIGHVLEQSSRAEHHRRHHRHGVGFKKVGGHSGAVADVVTDVVGNYRRVARIVFGNAGFDLAHQVGADVGALGENPAAQPCENRNQRPAESQPDQRLDRLLEIASRCRWRRKL